VRRRPQAALGALLLAAALAAAVGQSRSGPLYPETPVSGIVTFRDGDRFLSVRGERREVRVWGQRLAILLSSAAVVPGQFEIALDRWPLVVVPRRPAEDLQFIELEVAPALTSPFLSSGGLGSPGPLLVPEPDDARLELLEQNCLRAAWVSAAADARRAVGAGTAAVETRRLRNVIVEAGEASGLMHEAQHALDEAWRLDPAHLRNPLTDPEGTELRAMLAALAHTSRPHHALFDIVRQYRRHQPVYEGAARRLMAALAAEVAAQDQPVHGVDSRRNIPLQLPRLSPHDLRRLSAASMRRLYATSDQAAGYRLDYAADPDAMAGVRSGAVRGDIRAEDLPGPDALLWALTSDGPISPGAHAYLSPGLVAPDEGGLALGQEGFLALHLQPGGGRGIRIDGGPGLHLLARLGDQADVEIALRPAAGAPDHLEGQLPDFRGRRGVVRLIITGEFGVSRLRSVRLVDDAQVSSSERRKSATSR